VAGCPTTFLTDFIYCRKMPSQRLETDEQQLVEQIRRWSGSRFIGDDCAVLPGGLLVTSDSLVEGTHFNLGWTSLRDLGWKSCAVNLSDIAAMGGRARYITVNLTVPPQMKRRQVREFYESFVKCARTYRAQVVGGDLTSGPILVVSATVIGHVHENGCLKRSGARAGDVVVASGDFGASAAGLWVLENAQEARGTFAYCLERHLRPIPRLCESWAMVRKTASRGSLMDCSDGLADALVQISRASGVAMEIDIDSLPVHEQSKSAAARAGVDVTEWALYGGEDYELAGTMSPKAWEGWQGASDNPFVKIGTVQAGKNVKLLAKGKNAAALDLSKCFQQIGFE
jgi:thiamine-monophosphate kinase